MTLLQAPILDPWAVAWPIIKVIAVVGVFVIFLDYSKARLEGRVESGRRG